MPRPPLLRRIRQRPAHQHAPNRLPRIVAPGLLEILLPEPPHRDGAYPGPSRGSQDAALRDVEGAGEARAAVAGVVLLWFPAVVRVVSWGIVVVVVVVVVVVAVLAVGGGARPRVGVVATFAVGAAARTLLLLMLLGRVSFVPSVVAGVGCAVVSPFAPDVTIVVAAPAGC